MDRIPVEIYVSIRNRLDLLERVVLGATCRDLRWLEENPESLSRQVLRSNSPYERFELLLMGERQGEPRFKAEKACSYCLCAHHDSYFESKELQKPGIIRRCRGTTGRVKIRPGLSISWEGFESMIANPWPQNWRLDSNFPFDQSKTSFELFGPSGGVGPQRLPHDGFGGAMATGMITRNQYVRGPFAPEDFLASCTGVSYYCRRPVHSDYDGASPYSIGYKWTIRLDAFQSEEEVTPEVVTREIHNKALDLDMCPHISLAHPELVKMLAACVPTSSRIQELQCDQCRTRISVKLQRHRTHSIPIENKDRSRAHEWPIDALCAELAVRRGLGSLAGPTEDAWVTQMDVENPLDELLAEQSKKYAKTHWPCLDLQPRSDCEIEDVRYDRRNDPEWAYGPPKPEDIYGTVEFWNRDALSLREQVARSVNEPMSWTEIESWDWDQDDSGLDEPLVDFIDANWFSDADEPGLEFD